MKKLPLGMLWLGGMLFVFLAESVSGTVVSGQHQWHQTHTARVGWAVPNPANLFTGSSSSFGTAHPTRLPRIGGEMEHLGIGNAPDRLVAANEEESGKTTNDLKPFAEVTENTETLGGLFTIYRQSDTGKIYLEIQPEQLNKNFFFTATLASGLGELGIYRGWPLQDFAFQWRRVGNKAQLVVPNLNFRPEPGDPQGKAVADSFSDSVLSVVQIESIHPERNSLLIDITDLLLGDMAGLTETFPRVLGQAYRMDSEASYIGDAKAFAANLELETVHNFSQNGNSGSSPQTLADSRAFSLKVRYSFSELPENNGYQPRLADPRVGYFVTAYQNPSDLSRAEPFVRYIRRWHLEKQNPNAPLSPPKQPIVFWIENTVPVEYREAIREGVLMWNKAFEQAGFINAVEVRQMPDNAEWDPEDVNYNTIRWFNAFESGLIALGPSRANPVTGEILDADIIINGNALRDIRQQYQNLGGELAGATQGCFEEMGLSEIDPGLLAMAKENPRWGKVLQSWEQEATSEVCLGMEGVAQAAFGALVLGVNQQLEGANMEVYIHQFLRALVAHEVGHALGLRHNFRGSTMLMPEDLHNIAMTRNLGLVGSIMDYVPVNLAPPGSPQGDYFPVTLGEYDIWAIEYGYKPINASSPQGERPELEKIASRAGEDNLGYATDEDSTNTIDPTAKAYDLSADPLQYSVWQMENARAVWGKLDARTLPPGEGYSALRDRFDTAFRYYFSNANKATNYIGGQRFNRNHPTDPGARVPFEAVPVEEQRRALGLLQNYVFAEGAFNFPPEILNQLAPSRWRHWGSVPVRGELDYPISDRICDAQTSILISLLSSRRLRRLQDAEFKNPPGSVLTITELFDSLQTGIWSEISEKNNPAPTISPLRRSLQRQHLKILINLVLQDAKGMDNATNFLDFLIALQTLNAPDDARVLARHQLRQLATTIDQALKKRGNKMDALNRAHLQDTKDRIIKVLDGV